MSMVVKAATAKLLRDKWNFPRKWAKALATNRRFGKPYPTIMTPEIANAAAALDITLIELPWEPRSGSYPNAMMIFKDKIKPWDKYPIGVKYLRLNEMIEIIEYVIEEPLSPQEIKLLTQLWEDIHGMKWNPKWGKPFQMSITFMNWMKVNPLEVKE